MKIYHFCADRLLWRILKDGLTMGGVAVPEKKGFVMYTGWVWLTCDPDPTHQSWATQNFVQYSRTAWRLTIEIPELWLKNIFDRQQLSEAVPGAEIVFDGYPYSEQWRAFNGRIPREWIKAAEKMEVQGEAD